MSIKKTKDQRLSIIALCFICSAAIVMFVVIDIIADNKTAELSSAEELTSKNSDSRSAEQSSHEELAAQSTEEHSSELSPMEVIIKYMNDPEDNKELSIEDFSSECIASLKLIKIEPDNVPSPVYHARYTGEYSDVASFRVTYDIQYKPEYKNYVSEPSGVRTKTMFLVKTQNGWIIDQVGQ